MRKPKPTIRIAARASRRAKAAYFRRSAKARSAARMPRCFSARSIEPEWYDRSVADAEFLLRVRGAGESRVYRFSGAEAAELHRLRENRTLERPGGTHRLTELITGRDPDRSPAGGVSDVHFEMVAEDELR